jgi:hypothetical protein
MVSPACARWMATAIAVPVRSFTVMISAETLGIETNVKRQLNKQPGQAAIAFV